MTGVTIPVKRLRRVIQLAKEKREQNVTVHVSKGRLTFAIGGNMTLISLEGRENGNKQ